MLGGVIGHRQVTDAYLVALAAATGTQPVTLDPGLASQARELGRPQCEFGILA